MWWRVGTVVGSWAEGWVAWGGGVQVRNWEEFGKDWRSVDSGILKWKVMGSVVEFWVFGGGFWSGKAGGWRGCDAGILGEVGGGIGCGLWSGTGVGFSGEEEEEKV